MIQPRSQNPKLEARNPKQIQSSNERMFKTAARCSFPGAIVYRRCEFRASSFVLRASRGSERLSGRAFLDFATAGLSDRRRDSLLLRARGHDRAAQSGYLPGVPLRLATGRDAVRL